MGGSQEEVVKDFVRELQSIVETRPPVSKAKMMSITKAALKAVKFYKHVVMNVEKFIMKCKPEYKIPGLYVIDSVIRQSRHQYGIEKDVFGSRFAKNILNTLENIEKCPEDDKNKISRVLNLWEKNFIFAPDLIKQLFQAHDSNVNRNVTSTKTESTIDTNSAEKTSNTPDFERFRELQETLKRASVNTDSDTTTILTEIQQITNQLLESQKKSSINPQSVDEPSSTTMPIIHPTDTFHSNIANVLDDFDYGSDNDDDDNDNESHIRSTVQNPIPSGPIPKNLPHTTQFPQQQPTIFSHPNTSNTLPFSMNDNRKIMIPTSFDPTRPPPMFFQQPIASSVPHVVVPNNHGDNRRFISQPTDVDLRPEDMDDDNDDGQPVSKRPSSPLHDRYNRRRSRSRSPSRESKRTRSSSNSNNKRDSATSRLKEVEQRERRRKGLPPLKEDHLVVTSRTLWLGHLSKIITEAGLREILEPHGEITDIHHIVSRGCAFVCFKERSDAFRCLEKMKDFRFHGNIIRIAWAMSKGVKDRFKLYWDNDNGCTYIPYSELKDIGNLTSIAEGGTIDEESLPSFLKTSAPMIPIEQTPMISQQQAPPVIQPPSIFPHPEFQATIGLQTSAPTPVHVDQTNRLNAAPTFLMTPHQDAQIRVGLPVQMMPPGAQLIQVQPHPHGQPMQVVQRFGGPVFSNGQIIHQMPFGSVMTTSHPPPAIQIQTHSHEFKEFQQHAIPPGGGLQILTSTAGLPTQHHQFVTATPIVTSGPPLTNVTLAHTVDGSGHMQFHNDPHRRLPSSSPAPSSRIDEQHRSHLLTTDEQLMQLSNASSVSSSTRFSVHPPSLIGALPSSPNHTHSSQPPPQSHYTSSGNVGHLPQTPLLPMPTQPEDNQKQVPTYSRRPNRFEPREEVASSQDNNPSYAGNHGARNSYADRGNPNNASRINTRGRGAGFGNSVRGFQNNNTSAGGSMDRNIRSDSNDGNTGGYRNQGGFNRGGRSMGNSMPGGQSRFSNRGASNRYSNHEHSSNRRSSRSPDHHSGSYRYDHHTDKYSSAKRNYSSGSSDDLSYRSLPVEALRKRDQPDTDVSWNNMSNNFNKSSLTMDQTNNSRSQRDE